MPEERPVESKTFLGYHVNCGGQIGLVNNGRYSRMVCRRCGADEDNGDEIWTTTYRDGLPHSDLDP